MLIVSSKMHQILTFPYKNTFVISNPSSRKIFLLVSDNLLLRQSSNFLIFVNRCFNFVNIKIFTRWTPFKLPKVWYHFISRKLYSDANVLCRDRDHPVTVASPSRHLSNAAPLRPPCVLRASPFLQRPKSFFNLWRLRTLRHAWER